MHPRLVNQVTHLGGFEVDVRDLIGPDLDFLGNSTRFQLHIHRKRLGNCQREIGGMKVLKLAIFTVTSYCPTARFGML